MSRTFRITCSLFLAVSLCSGCATYSDSSSHPGTSSSEPKEVWWKTVLGTLMGLGLGGVYSYAQSNTEMQSR
jgi:hypothetical protein